MKTLTSAAGLALLGLAGTAQAQPADPWGDATIARAGEEKAASDRFVLIDTNGDGAISAEELEASLQGQRRPGGGSRADINGDGKISKDEYVGAQLRRFDSQDADGNGQLTKAERDAARARRPQGGSWGGQ